MEAVTDRMRHWSRWFVRTALPAQISSDPSHGRDPYPAIRTIRSWAPGDVIFDVGANDGRTISRLQKHFPSPSIFAFEPVSSTFQTLVARTEHLPNVRCQKLALGAEPGEDTIYLNPVASTNSFSPTWGEPVGNEVVEVSTVDRVMAEQGIDRIHFLKIDTEGHELEVLKGARQALSDSRITIVQVEVGIDSRVSPHTGFDEVRRHLAPLGYYVYGIFNQCRGTRRVRPPAAWSAEEAEGYEPRLIKYFDAVFISASLEQGEVRA